MTSISRFRLQMNFFLLMFNVVEEMSRDDKKDRKYLYCRRRRRRRRRRKFLTRHKMITEVSLISAGCVRPRQTTSGHRGNFANPRLAETTETTGQIGAGIENTQDQPSHHWHWENLHITLPG